MPTIGEMLVQVREMESRAAVKRVLAGYLRLRYVGRDSSPAVARIANGDGSSVSEEVVESEARLLEEEAVSIEKSMRAAKAGEVQRDR